jgi:hypothetical protein
MSKKTKDIELSPKDVIEAIEKAGYEGLFIFIDPETKKTTFSVNAKERNLARCLYAGYRQDRDFYEMVMASIFAYAVMDEKAMEAVRELSIMSKGLSELLKGKENE